jgi:hypothetical protein
MKNKILQPKETKISKVKLNNNKIEDLKKFLEKRNCLNNTNQILNYLFHVIQSAGVLTTTIAAGYNIKELVWVGVGMNILASLINIFEKTNDSISKRMFKNIQAIKNGTYIDEGMLIDADSKPGDDKPYFEATASEKTTSSEKKSERVERIEKVEKMKRDIEKNQSPTTDTQSPTENI